MASVLSSVVDAGILKDRINSTTPAVSDAALRAKLYGLTTIKITRTDGSEWAVTGDRIEVDALGCLIVLSPDGQVLAAVSPGHWIEVRIDRPTSGPRWALLG